jgi:hypothetical protein
LLLLLGRYNHFNRLSFVVHNDAILIDGGTLRAKPGPFEIHRK